MLLTAIVEVESLEDSRPLTDVSSNADDLEALTPNHFIIGRPTPNLPPGIFIDNRYHAKRVGDKRTLLPLTFGKNGYVRTYLA